MGNLSIKNFHEFRRKARACLNREIWQTRYLDEKGPRAQAFAFLRIMTITFHGLAKNNLFVRAAALCYSSLLALGPLIAIIVLVSGFVLQGTGDRTIEDSIQKFISFISPSVSEMIEMEQMAEDIQGGSGETTSELQALINTFISSAKSGTGGAVGILLLVAISIQLLTAIEKAFNDIWGVRQGRNWFNRIFYYWSFITLGPALAFSAITLVSFGKVVEMLDNLPFGPILAQTLSLAAPILSFLIVIILLTIFFRFIPNTTVFNKPAAMGALFVATLLFLNNYLSFLYVSRVITSKSLYGSVAIFPILMFGLYLFWLLILFGGQLTYAIQNVNNLTNQEAWEEISEYTQENLCLAAYLLICRRFVQCQKPYKSSDLAHDIRAPYQIVNNSLSTLTDVGLIHKIIPNEDENNDQIEYSPAIPLHKVTLGDFKMKIERNGNNEGAELIQGMDPIIGTYARYLERVATEDMASKTFEQLLEEEHMPAELEEKVNATES